MDSYFPATGTAKFLAALSPHIPDAFINDLVPRRRGRGRRSELSAAQLWRLHLLSVLTLAHSFNQLVRLLPEQPAWRRFGHLSPRQPGPDVWQLNQFRERVGVGGLRAINDHLVGTLLPGGGGQALSVALIDATDLEAACSGHKKRAPGTTPPNGPRWEGGHSNVVKAVSLSDTRNTAFGCGCPRTAAGCC